MAIFADLVIPYHTQTAAPINRLLSDSSPPDTPSSKSSPRFGLANLPYRWPCSTNLRTWWRPTTFAYWRSLASRSFCHQRRTYSVLPNGLHMVILRPTQKLHRALPVTKAALPESETALGDWYVNRLVVDRRPLLLLVSSKGLFPLLVPARDVSSLPHRLPQLLAASLRRVGVPEDHIVAECAAMSPVVLAPTRDRSLLGVLNDSIERIPFHLERERWTDDALPIVEYHLASTPWFAKNQVEKVTFPLKVVPELLAARWAVH